MDYFHDLLGSYKKLKARKLKLVESVDPEQKAYQELKNAKSYHPEPSRDHPYVAQGARTKVAIFNTHKGWKYSPTSHKAVSGRKINLMGSRFIDADFERYVGYFREEELHPRKPNANEPQEIDEPEIESSDPMQEEQGGMFVPSELTTDIAPIINEIFEGIPKDLIEGQIWEDPMSFQNFIIGPFPESLEFQIQSQSLSIQHNKLLDQYLTLIQPSNPELTKDIVSKFKFCLECLTKNNIYEDEKNKIKNIFLINSDQSVTVTSDTKNTGMVFSDPFGFIKMLVSALSKKFLVKIRTNNLPDISHLDWAVRGIGLNEIFSLISLNNQLLLYQSINHPGTQSLVAGITQILTNIKTKLMLINNDYATWNLTMGSTGVDFTNKTIINAFTTLLNQITGSLFINDILANIQFITSQSLSDFVIPRFRELEEGRKQDTFFVYRDFNKAKSYLLKLGITDQEILSKGIIKQLTVEEVFRTKEDLLGICLQSQLFLPGQIVFYIPVSIRNYLQSNRHELGNSNSLSLSNLLTGISTDPFKLFISKFHETFKQINLLEVQKLSNELLQNSSKIENLEYKVKARTEKQKLVDFNLFDNFVKSSLEIIKNTSDYKDLNDTLLEDQSLRDLSCLLNRYIDSSEENKELIIKIKSYLSLYLNNKKIISAVDKGAIAAKSYLAVKLFNCIGTVDTGMLVYNSCAQPRKLNVFIQNDIVVQIISGWLNGEGWQLRAKGNTFTFYSEMNPKLRIVMEDIPDHYSNSHNTVCYASSELIQSISKTGMTNESLILNLLNNQKLLFEEVLSIAKKEPIGQAKQIFKLN